MRDLAYYKSALIELRTSTLPRGEKSKAIRFAQKRVSQIEVSLFRKEVHEEVDDNTIERLLNSGQ